MYNSVLVLTFTLSVILQHQFSLETPLGRQVSRPHCASSCLLCLDPKESCKTNNKQTWISHTFLSTVPPCSDVSLVYRHHLLICSMPTCGAGLWVSPARLSVLSCDSGQQPLSCQKPKSVRDFPVPFHPG